MVGCISPRHWISTRSIDRGTIGVRREEAPEVIGKAVERPAPQDRRSRRRAEGGLLCWPQQSSHLRMVRLNQALRTPAYERATALHSSDLEPSCKFFSTKRALD